MKQVSSTAQTQAEVPTQFGIGAPDGTIILDDSQWSDLGYLFPCRKPSCYGQDKEGQSLGQSSPGDTATYMTICAVPRDPCGSLLSTQMTSDKPTCPQCTNVREVLIADANVPGIAALLTDIDPAVEIWMCDGTEGDDALDMLAEGLVLPNISRVHLVALGQPGSFVMGGKSINSECLRSRFGVGTESGIRRTEIVLWSSNVARSAAGREFVSLLAELTGCRVRAASRPLGNIDGQTCWTLDVVVRPHIPFHPSQMNAFTENLNLGHNAPNCPELGAHAWPTIESPQTD